MPRLTCRCLALLSFTFTLVFSPFVSADSEISWHTFLGSNDGDFGNSVAVDGSGNIYVSGDSLAGWGSPINPHTGDNDAYVAKLESNGVLLWNTFLGSSDFDSGWSVAADGSGNLYVSGSSVAGWGLSINPHAGGWDAFVAKLDSSGVLQWHTFLGSSDSDLGMSIATDGSGNLYVSGHSSAGWGSPINPHAGGDDAFVVKLNSSGVLQWHTFLGSSGTDRDPSVAADGNGNLYVTGHSYLTWGSPINPHAGDLPYPDIFVAKLNSSGALQWHTFLGSNSDYWGLDVAADGNGNLYVTSLNYGSWGSPINPHAGEWDAFVAKIYDLEIDDDGWSNDTDGCPYDLNKSNPGACGCGVADTDSDSDGTFDCNDECPLDPEKTLTGLCGCGVSDVDSNGNGTADCLDQFAVEEIISTSSSGIRYWDAAKSEWTQMTSSIPTGDIASGDFTGDSKADVASIWNSGLWYQDGDTLAWTKIPGTAPVSVTAGDVTGDGRFEIIGTWSNGIWYWDVAASNWTKMTASTPTGDIAAGDFTGDGKAEVASCWRSGLWYQDGATFDWTKVSNTVPTQLTAGDVTGQ